MRKRGPSGIRLGHAASKEQSQIRSQVVSPVSHSMQVISMARAEDWGKVGWVWECLGSMARLWRMGDAFMCNEERKENLKRKTTASAEEQKKPKGWGLAVPCAPPGSSLERPAQPWWRRPSHGPQEGIVLPNNDWPQRRQSYFCCDLEREFGGIRAWVIPSFP